MKVEFMRLPRRVELQWTESGVQSVHSIPREFSSDPCKKIFDWFDQDGDGNTDEREKRSRGGIYFNNKVGFEEFEKTLIDFDPC